ncbi:MAG: mechanosensitive ion channel family protein [Patescibacteria group bacterium]|jgi:small-conductance mechanosensitive channel
MEKLIIFIFYVAVFYVASFVITILTNIIGRFASKTKTDLDDRIIKAIKLPIRYLAIILGLFYGIKYSGIYFSIGGYGLNDALKILVILLAAFAVARIIKAIMKWIANKKRKETKSRGGDTLFIFFRKIINVAVYLVALIIILGQLGIEIGPLLAGLGVAGIAIALGLQKTLENLFAAVFLVLDKTINIGDYVELNGGTRGHIADISWRATTITTLGENTIIIPNSDFVNQTVTSFDWPTSQQYMSVTVGVAYDSDFIKVEKVLEKIVKFILQKEKMKLDGNDPIIRFDELGDSAVTVKAIFKVDRAADENKIRGLVNREILVNFAKEKINIPFPQRVVHLEK